MSTPGLVRRGLALAAAALALLLAPGAALAQADFAPDGRRAGRLERAARQGPEDRRRQRHRIHLEGLRHRRMDQHEAYLIEWPDGDKKYSGTTATRASTTRSTR